MSSHRKFSIQPLWAIASVTPVLFLLTLSLAGEWRFPSLFPDYWSFENWRLLLRNRSGLLNSFLLSVFLSGMVSILSTAIGFWLSRWMAAYPHRRILIGITYLPFVFSPLIFASVIDFYFIWLDLSGLIFGVIIAQIFITLPFSMLLFVDYWDARLKALEDLVFTLGGSSSQAYLKVILPVSKNILLLCLFQTFLTSWFDYGLTSVIGVGKIQTLTIKVFQFVGEANPNYAAVSSCLLIVPPMLLLFANKNFLFNSVK